MRSFLALGILAATISTSGCFFSSGGAPVETRPVADPQVVEAQIRGVLDYVAGRADALPPLPADAPPPDQGLPLLEIAGKLRVRYAEVGDYKAHGCFAENNRGYAELRDCDTVLNADAKNAAQKLMADDNKDRKALYAEIARQNAGQNVAGVEAIAAQQWFIAARSGEWAQLPPEGAALDACRESANGKKLGEKCVEEAWVQIP